MDRAVTGASFAVLLHFGGTEVLHRTLTVRFAVNQRNTTQVSETNPATFDSHI